MVCSTNRADEGSTVPSMRVCLVLGAGASLANALYFRGQRMAHTRPPLDDTFFETVQGLHFLLTPALRTYLRGLLRTDPLPERMRALTSPTPS